LSFTSWTRRIRSSVHARRRSAVSPPPNRVFAGGFLDLLARGLDVLKKPVGFVQNVGDQFHRAAFSQRGEEALFRARIPQAI